MADFYDLDFRILVVTGTESQGNTDKHSHTYPNHVQLFTYPDLTVKGYYKWAPAR